MSANLIDLLRKIDDLIRIGTVTEVRSGECRVDMVAIAGLILSSRLGAGSPSAGNIAELDAIAACVIGGTSLAGGVGSVAGAVMGAFIMASLDNGMSMMDVPTFWQYIVKGAILLLAVWMDSATKRRS